MRGLLCLSAPHGHPPSGRIPALVANRDCSDLRRRRQVPALIAVFELAGTAVALQRHTEMVRPDRHAELP
jgi:hypothetical protein